MATYEEALKYAEGIAYEEAVKYDLFMLIVDLCTSAGFGALAAAILPLPYPFLEGWGLCSCAILMVITFTWVISFRTWVFAMVAMVLDALSTLASVAIVAYALVLTSHQVDPSWQNQLMLGVLVIVLVALFIGSSMLWCKTHHLSKPQL